MHVVMIGCGAVGKTVILYWNKIVPHIKYDKFTIIEPIDLPSVITSGKLHIKDRVTPTNYNMLLLKLNPDLIVDVSVYVGSTTIINWCFVNNVPYISTAIEDWEGVPPWKEDESMYEHTLLFHQRAVMQLNTYKGPTVLVDHGMNPGLISHFTKLALEKICASKKIPMKSYQQMARDLDVQVIQCSEIDTQTVSFKRDEEIFVNTWSAVGFHEEGSDPAQIGWGSHETPITDKGAEKDLEQVFLRKRGMNCLARGYNPLEGEYVGMCIPHSESATISRYLTLDNYRPSSYYVYKPAQCAMESLEDVRKNDYQMLPYYHVVTCNDIIDGKDAVGALLMLGNGESYWAGTILSKDDIPSEFYPYTNPTIVQVACGVLSGIDHIVKYPHDGVIFPEELDSHRVLELTKDYLGEVVFKYVDCTLPRSFVDLLVE